MTREELEKIRLGTLLEVQNKLELNSRKVLVVCCRNNQIGVVEPESLTREAVLSKIMMEHIFYFTIQLLLNPRASFVRNTKLITQKDVIKLKLMDIKDLLTDKAWIEASDYCFGNQLKPLHVYTFATRTQEIEVASDKLAVMIRHYNCVPYEVLPDELYQDLGYIKPSVYYDATKACRYVQKDDITGIRLGNSKVGIIKEPLYDIRDILHIEDIVQDKDFKETAIGYAVLIVQEIRREYVL